MPLTLPPQEKFVLKTADETVNNSAVLQNDDELLFPIGTNEVWFCEAFLQLNAASATADFQFTFTGPAGASGAWHIVGRAPDNASTGFNGVALATNVNAFIALGAAGSVGASAVSYGLIIAGWFTAAATAGTIQLQWAQNTATVENSKVLKNSFLRLRKLA